MKRFIFDQKQFKIPKRSRELVSLELNGERQRKKQKTCQIIFKILHPAKKASLGRTGKI